MQNRVDRAGIGATAWNGFFAAFGAQICVAALDNGERIPDVSEIYR